MRLVMDGKMTLKELTMYYFKRYALPRGKSSLDEGLGDGLKKYWIKLDTLIKNSNLEEKDMWVVGPSGHRARMISVAEFE